MSFEGFDRILCKSGHLHTFDVYDQNFHYEGWRCPWCGEPIAWSETIDQTNGYDPESETKLRLRKKAEVHTCKECKQLVVNGYDIYYIPKSKQPKRKVPKKIEEQYSFDGYRL